MNPKTRRLEQLWLPDVCSLRQQAVPTSLARQATWQPAIACNMHNVCYTARMPLGSPGPVEQTCGNLPCSEPPPRLRLMDVMLYLSLLATAQSMAATSVDHFALPFASNTSRPISFTPGATAARKSRHNKHMLSLHIATFRARTADSVAACSPRHSVVKVAACTCALCKASVKHSSGCFASVQGLLQHPRVHSL